MSGFVNGAIFYVTAFIFLTGAGLVWDVWRHKECFEIAPRSPLLLCLAGATHVILVLLQMMAGVNTRVATGKDNCTVVCRVCKVRTAVYSSRYP